MQPDPSKPSTGYLDDIATVIMLGIRQGMADGLKGSFKDAGFGPGPSFHAFGPKFDEAGNRIIRTMNQVKQSFETAMRAADRMAAVQKDFKGHAALLAGKRPDEWKQDLGDGIKAMGDFRKRVALGRTFLPGGEAEGEALAAGRKAREAGKADEAAKGAKTFASSVGMMQQAMSALVQAGGFAIVANQARAFVDLASPGDVVLFNLALRDFKAVIGQMLLPLIRAGKDAIRYLADTLITLSPEAKRVITSLVAAGIAVAGFAGVVTALKFAMMALNGVGGWLGIVIGAIVAIFAHLAMSMNGSGRVGERFRAVFDRLGQLFQGLLESLGNALTMLLPLLEAFVGLLERIADSLHSTSDEARFEAERWRKSGGVIGEAMAQHFDKAAVNLARREARDRVPKDGKSMGAAVVPMASGSSDELYRRNVASAFQLGEAQTPESKRLDKIQATLDKMTAEMPDRHRQLLEGVKQFLGSADAQGQAMALLFGRLLNG